MCNKAEAGNPTGIEAAAAVKIREHELSGEYPP